LIKAQDKLIARRADTKARADFATWTMMVKLNGASSLPDEAHAFLSSYRGFLETMPETEASEATIGLMYKDYYADMGGAGTPPDITSIPKDPIVEVDNVTAFRRPAPRQREDKNPGTRPRLPVALIFILLVVIYVGIRYYFFR
jgi:hypothetical protein